ncbi:hypothetical protein [Asticcacaulis machinosus]|uniref:Uncharacterized protein n=1 Tax=Asticcacaulis machinosus TaxID=2984211 RepID=A0ABT5HHM3_9CAUL|nr:hypothetical protein [Asticcacaulis machinosus]MDC7675084.1 hypothetical protein [Asticcacaulis machinosus]
MDVAIVWGTLMLAPPAAFALMALTRKHVPRFARPVLIASATLIGLVLLAMILKIAFINPIANIVALSVAYLAYTLLWAAIWQLESPALKILLGIASSLPIAAGYFFAAFGMLGFMFAGYTSPPVYTAKVDERFTCEIRYRDGGPSYGTYEVGVYYRWANIPAIQQQVAVFPKDARHMSNFEDECPS